MHSCLCQHGPFPQQLSAGWAIRVHSSIFLSQAPPLLVCNGVQTQLSLPVAVRTTAHDHGVFWCDTASLHQDILGVLTHSTPGVTLWDLVSNTGSKLQRMAHLDLLKTAVEWVLARGAIYLFIYLLAGMRDGCLPPRSESQFPAFISKWSRSISQVPRQEAWDPHYTAVSPWHCQPESLGNSWSGSPSLVCWVWC